MLTCHDVANYFLVLVDREAGDLITQLKLQKLIYFAQGANLALFEKPLFEEPIEAWEHGPVVRELRKSFGQFRSDVIPIPGEIEFDIYSTQQKELIYKVYKKYGEHTAAYLRNLTHGHPTWIDAFTSQHKIIEQDKIKDFFKTFIDDKFLIMSEKDKQRIISAEDEWWMGYDTGIPSEDISKFLKENYLGF